MQSKKHELSQKTFLLGNRQFQGVILTPNKLHSCCFFCQNEDFTVF